MAGEACQYEREAQWPGRESRRIRVHFIPDRDADGVLRGVLVVTIDIEDDHRLRLALEDQRKRLQLVIDNIGVPMSYIDRDLRFRFANRPGFDWRSATPEEAIGRRVDEVFDAETMVTIAPHVAAALAGEKRVYERAARAAGRQPALGARAPGARHRARRRGAGLLHAADRHRPRPPPARGARAPGGAAALLRGEHPGADRRGRRGLPLRVREQGVPAHPRRGPGGDRRALRRRGAGARGLRALLRALRRAPARRRDLLLRAPRGPARRRGALAPRAPGADHGRARRASTATTSSAATSTTSSWARSACARSRSSCASSPTTSPIPSPTSTASGAYVFANRQFAALRGAHAASEIIGTTTVEQVLGAEIAAWIAERTQNVLDRGEVATYERQMTLPDGADALVPREGGAAHRRGRRRGRHVRGGPRHRRGEGRAGAQLAASEEELRFFAENIPEAIVLRRPRARLHLREQPLPRHARLHARVRARASSPRTSTRPR